ncbi:MAG: radical SAM protein [Candidatus Saganbacteria bacterium]|nr:radical SAM protein [Candidatus Saganbacteria bacterium]
MVIKQEEYKDFSWVLHQKAGHKPIVVQMELTLRCPLHCQHCYAEIYPPKEAIKHELSTKQIKMIMDKCKAAGTVWFCFTGGDPLLRKDFIELYLYAKELGFITSVFTSLATLTPKILEAFKKSPPFDIETTLNAATSKTYKEVTQTNLFEKQVGAIRALLKNNIPVRVKTQVTKQNVGEIDKIKELVESWGLKFRPSTMIHARLNGDTHPCAIRLDPKDAIRINKNYGYFEEEESRQPREKLEVKDLIGKPNSNKLVGCAAGGHAFWVTVDGEMVICSTLRQPVYDLLKKGHTVEEGFYTLNKKVHSMCFKTQSRCRDCKYRRICKWCPARAYLETGSVEKSVDYYCLLAEETVKEYVKK